MSQNGKITLELIYETMNRRFDEVEQRFTGVEGRFVGIDKRFDGIDKRFDEMLKMLGRYHRDHEARITALENKRKAG